MKKLKQKEIERLEAIDFLKKSFANEKSPALYIIIRSVAPSGMSRTMSVYNNDMQNISNAVSKLLELPLTKEYNYSFRVSGCGMDMCFWLANALTNAVYTKEEQKINTWLNGNGDIPCLTWKVL